jgi:hypothetical protein
LVVEWRLGDGSMLILLANLTSETAEEARPPEGRLLYSTHDKDATSGGRRLPPWSAQVYLNENAAL